jgi:hypothetical protein
MDKSVSFFGKLAGFQRPRIKSVQYFMLIFRKVSMVYGELDMLMSFSEPKKSEFEIIDFDSSQLLA